MIPLNDRVILFQREYSALSLKNVMQKPWVFKVHKYAFKLCEFCSCFKQGDTLNCCTSNSDTLRIYPCIVTLQNDLGLGHPSIIFLDGVKSTVFWYRLQHIVPHVLPMALHAPSVLATSIQFDSTRHISGDEHKWKFKCRMRTMGRVGKVESVKKKEREIWEATYIVQRKSNSENEKVKAVCICKIWFLL